MSIVDYTQAVEDHSSVLILVQQAGSHLAAKSFTKLYDRLARLDALRVKNQHRSISIRYKKFYPSENNAWGEFQAHRKVLGIVCFAKCNHPDELTDLYKLYEGIKSQYGNTLYDSRLVVFGLDPQQTGSHAGTPDIARKGVEIQKSPDTSINASSDKLKNKLKSDFGLKSPLVRPDVTTQLVAGRGNNVPDVVLSADQGKLSRTVTSNGSVHKQTLNTGEADTSASVPTDLVQTNKSDIETIEHLPTKNEDVQQSNSDTTTVTSQDKPGDEQLGCHGDTRDDRSGSTNSQSSESSTSSYTRDAPPYVIFFLDPDDCPKLEGKVHDFMSSLFWVLESKRLDRSHEKLDKLPMLAAPFERRDLVGVDTDSRVYRKRCQGRLKKHLGDLCLLSGLPGEAMLHYQTAMETLKSCSDWLWLAGAIEGLCACYVIVATPSIDAGSNGGLARNHSFNVTPGSTAAKEVLKVKSGSHKNLLNGLDGARERIKTLPGDMADKYTEAVSYYAKYRAAAVVEMECNIKACRVLASQKRYLGAAGFLQNIIYINITLTEDEKILRYNTLSSLYAQLHMKRKAGFFKRIAAMQCVAPSNPRPGWTQCYYLLLQALDGYGISLDPKYRAHSSMLGWPVAQLRVLHELIYSARKMGNPAIAIRHITYLFHVMYEHLVESDRLELVKILESYTTHCEGSCQTLALENGFILPPVPFHKFPTITMFKLECPAERSRVFKIKRTSSLPVPQGSPFIYSPIQTQNKLHNSSLDVVWQEGDMCHITVKASNPLHVDLTVENINLVTEGVACTVNHSSISIAAQSCDQFVLQTTPTKPGSLKILGYQTTVLGCRSNCRFKDSAHLDLAHYEVKVVPRLPHLTLTLRSDHSRLLDNVRVDEGGVLCADVTLYAGQSCECSVLLQNTSDLPVEQIQVTSLAQTDQSLVDKVLKWNVSNLNAQLPLKGGCDAVLTLYMCGALTPAQPTGPLLSSKLLVEYSGGAGLEDDYCRHGSIQLSIKLQPSLVVNDTRVLPSFSVDTCWLELDVYNASHYNMSIISPALSQPSTLSSQQTNSLKLCVPRCKQDLSNQQGPLNSAGSNQLETALQSSVHSSQSGDSLKCMTLSNQIAEHMRNFVDVRWTMIEPNIEGKVELSELPWHEIHREGLAKPQVAVCVCVNGAAYSDSEVIMTSLCTPVHVTCSLTNTSDCDDISHMTCCLSCDVTPSRSREQSTHSCVTFLGQAHIHTKQLKAGESIQLQTDLQVFYEGVYSVNVTCQGHAMDIVDLPEGQGHELARVPAIQISVTDDSSS